jgi:hypothetical protein
MHETLDEHIASAFEDRATSTMSPCSSSRSGMPAAKKRRQERSTGSLGFNAAFPPDECSTVIKGPPIQ